MSFFENTRKPQGVGGRVMVSMMNIGHHALASWGLQFLSPAPDARILDCGCGGGANIKRMLKQCPQGIVKGIDYSPVSVDTGRGDKWAEKIGGMTIYRDVQLKAMLEQTGFRNIQVHKNRKDWLCITAQK